MSKAMITRYMSLDLICLKGVGLKPELCTEIPTWALNWPKLWSGTLTIQEEGLLRELTIGTSNPILDGSTNQVLNVFAARVGSIKNLTATLTAYVYSPAESPRKRWILERHPGFANASEHMVKTCHAIWKTLTMDQLPPDISDSRGLSCFEHLWRPEGRGTIEDLNLIKWVDEHAMFEIGRRTLRTWSQVIPEGEVIPSNQATPSEHAVNLDPSVTIPGSFDSIEVREAQSSVASIASDRSYNPRDMNAFIGALHRVLDSGMRLADIDYEVCSVAMVHPDAQINDEVFYIRGCSIPVVLRYEQEDDGYMVIGGAYLHEDLKTQFLSRKKTWYSSSFAKEIHLY
jgi:hypothetical protein